VVLWEPPAGVPVRFSVLHVPAAAEEMNKSRRMVALQARAFAIAGGAVALLDPRGTGDSGGDHADATWAGWCDDIGVAWGWLRGRAQVPSALWGLRLGALLAIDAVARCALAPDALLLWQPVSSGKQWVNQFLRLATAREMTGAGGGAETKALRADLAAGRTVEVAGYGLSPELVSGAEACDLGSAPAPRCPVIMREVTLASPSTISPAMERVVAHWTAAGAKVDGAAVEGPSFWASQEIAEAPNLVAATTAPLVKVLGVVANGTE
jgi:exosortase A-associated hydrolase 2